MYVEYDGDNEEGGEVEVCVGVGWGMVGEREVEIGGG